MRFPSLPRRETLGEREGLDEMTVEMTDHDHEHVRMEARARRLVRVVLELQDRVAALEARLGEERE